MPTEVVTDVKAEILSAGYSFKGVTMEPVYVVSPMSFFGTDVNDLTFSGWNSICHFSIPPGGGGGGVRMEEGTSVVFFCRKNNSSFLRN